MLVYQITVWYANPPKVLKNNIGDWRDEILAIDTITELAMPDDKFNQKKRKAHMSNIRVFVVINIDGVYRSCWGTINVK